MNGPKIMMNEARLKEKSSQLSNGRFLVQVESSILCANPSMSVRLSIPYILQQFVASGVVLSRCQSILIFDVRSDRCSWYCRRLLAFTLEEQK